MLKYFLLLFLLFLVPNAQALSLISDEETESFLYDILTPLFKEAELPLKHENIHIVKDDSLNAFVGDKNHMFVHTGTLLKATSANEIEGVLAHETGHILGGHILRLKIKLKDMQKATLMSVLAAGAAAAASGRGDAAIAIVLGTQSSAINSLTSYQITEERAADETAVQLLNKNKKSIKGLKNFMQKIQNENRLGGIEEQPYFRTHPMTTERVAFLEDKLKTSAYISENSKLDNNLNRIKAKLIAYLSPLSEVIKKYPLSDTTVEATIAHAIYYMRQKNLNTAQKYYNKLLTLEPNNPYFWEIKAQTLFETGHLKEAKIAYKQTLNLKPSSDNFKLSYAEAALTAPLNANERKELIVMLEHTARNGLNPLAYHYLGKIYADWGDEPAANYFAAEYNAAIGEEETARRQLKKAMKSSLKPNLRLRAEDLLTKLNQEKRTKSLL